MFFNKMLKPHKKRQLFFTIRKIRPVTRRILSVCLRNIKRNEYSIQQPQPERLRLKKENAILRFLKAAIQK